MGAVAECGRKDCKGALASTFDKDGNANGFYCERCGTVFAEVAHTAGRAHGIKPSGRIHEREEVAAMEAELKAAIRARQDVLDEISALVENDKSPIGKAVNDALEPLKAGV